MFEARTNPPSDSCPLPPLNRSTTISAPNTRTAQRPVSSAVSPAGHVSLKRLANLTNAGPPPYLPRRRGLSQNRLQHHPCGRAQQRGLATWPQIQVAPEAGRRLHPRRRHPQPHSAAHGGPSRPRLELLRRVLRCLERLTGKSTDLCRQEHRTYPG